MEKKLLRVSFAAIMSDESSKDEYTVCDQCRARKIRCSRDKPSCRNCHRLGLQCEWSGQGKKCNQTTLLSHTVLGIGSRLQQLEASLLETQNSLKRLYDQSSIALSSAPPSPRRPGTGSSLLASDSILNTVQHLPTTSSSKSSSSSIQAFHSPPPRILVSENGQDARYFGPTMLESMMLTIRDELSQGINVNNNYHATKDSILSAQRKIEILVGKDEQLDLAGVMSPPTISSFAILDAMISPFFATIHPHFPIWTKSSFLQMVDSLRSSSPSKRDLASIICCNNLVLMAMSAETLASLKRELIQANETQNSTSMDFDVMEGFLANAKRAVRNMDQLIAPRLTNVQALLSLSVVAKEFFSMALSESIFTLAVKCAKSIGIHQWHSLQDQLSDEEVQQRQNISYYLYAIDKAHLWVAGSTPSVLLSEVRIQASPGYPEENANSLIGVKAQMAKVEETVFLEIFAPHAKPKSEQQVRMFTSTVLSGLQDCISNAGIDLDKLQDSTDNMSVSNLQLTIRYFCINLLIIWTYKMHPHCSFQRGPEVARVCLKLLLRLWHCPSEQGSHIAFPFFLATLPPVYVYQVFSSIISGQGSDADVETVQDFVDMLGTITYGHAEASYNKRLLNFCLIVVDLLKTTKPRHKRQRIAPETQALNSHSISDFLSPPQSRDYGDINSEMQQTLENAVFQDAEDSFNLISPSTSKAGDFGYDMDEMFPYLRNYVPSVMHDGNRQPSTMRSARESGSDRSSRPRWGSRDQ